MSVKRWLGRNKDEEEYQDYKLATMQVGFLVDYDLRTWQVTAYQTYDFDGFLTQEWEMRQGQEVRYLERAEEDGSIELSFTRRIDLNQIEEAVVDAIIETENPPETVQFEGRQYTAVEHSAGLMRENGEGDGREFVNWSYESEGKRALFITQWGERDIVAFEGTYAEEYEFADILPGTLE